MEGIKISVIVPVYNTVKWLERCIKSIQNQTWSNLEIIIVNDGSTDGSGELAEQLAKADGRIQVFHKENGGASTARNMGIDKASGEYIGFIDSDDYIEPQMYTHLMELIQKEQLLMAQASRDEIDQEGNVLKDICVPPEKTEIMESYAFIRELLLHRGDASFCTKLIKANLFDDDRFPEGVLNEDFHLLVRLLPKVERIAVIPEQYYHVFYRLDSTTRRKSNEEFPRVFMDIVDNADMMEAIVARECPILKKEARRFGLYQRLDYLLHIPITRMKRDNKFYRNVIGYIRAHFADILFVPYLERKFRLYLVLFCIAPKTLRRMHRATKKK
ncbi:MAG: glycosyltransferase [Lachnospiraceae bacterium]|nr:glycosyltransferase [Lachnospiraceae bacterium]